MKRAVIGVRDLTGHIGTGRVAIVVLTPDPALGEPSLAARMDSVLVPKDPPARVYHECSGLPVPEAEALVAEVERVTNAPPNRFWPHRSGTRTAATRCSQCRSMAA